MIASAKCLLQRGQQSSNVKRKKIFILDFRYLLGRMHCVSAQLVGPMKQTFNLVRMNRTINLISKSTAAQVNWSGANTQSHQVKHL